MKNVLFYEDTEDVNRRPETKVVLKVQIRNQGTRQRLNMGGYIIRDSITLQNRITK